MTVETTHITESVQADGLALSFQFSFRCDDTGAVKAFVNGEAATPLVALNDDQLTTPGGRVTFAAPPPAGAVVELRRVTAPVQLTALDPYNKFPSDAVEAALDAAVMRDQELAAKLDAALGVGGGVTVDVAGTEITPVGSLLTRTLAAWLSRLDPEGGPIPVTATGGTRNTLAGWMAQVVELAAAVQELGGVVGGGGGTTPTGNRIGAGTLAERDAISNWTAGDLWFDTADGWHPYRFNGLGWDDIINPGLASRNRTFVQPDAPVSPVNGVPLVDGDIWFDTDAGYAIARWNGTSWDPVRDTGTIDAARLAGTLPVARLADGSIDAAKIAAAMKGDGANPVSWLAANAIGAVHIIANAITAGHIRAGAVTADAIDALAITAGKIAAGAVQAAHIATGSITTSHLSFVPVESSKVIAAIRASGEALLIQGSKIDIAGNTTFQALDMAVAGKANASLSNVTVIDGGKLSADSLKTSDYAWSGPNGANSPLDWNTSGEVPTRGARLRNAASPGALPAILTSPEGLKVGAKTLDQTWMAQARPLACRLSHLAGTPTVYIDTVIAGSLANGTVTPGGLVTIPLGAALARTPVMLMLQGRIAGSILGLYPLGASYGADLDGLISFYLMSNGGGQYGVEAYNAAWEAQLWILLGASSFA